MEFVRMRVRQVPLRVDSTLTQVQVRVSLRCQSVGCGHTVEYTLANFSDIWRWGLDGKVRDGVESLLRYKHGSSDDSYEGNYPKQPIPGMFVCERCGSPSFVPDNDKRRMAGIIASDVGHLVAGIGPKWALAECDHFMRSHLKAGLFVHHDCYFPGGHHSEERNLFLLYRCPCERCEKDRVDTWRRAKLNPVHFDPDYIRSLMPTEVET